MRTRRRRVRRDSQRKQARIRSNTPSFARSLESAMVEGILAVLRIFSPISSHKRPSLSLSLVSSRRQHRLSAHRRQSPVQVASEVSTVAASLLAPRHLVRVHCCTRIFRQSCQRHRWTTRRRSRWKWIHRVPSRSTWRARNTTPACDSLSSASREHRWSRRRLRSSSNVEERSSRVSKRRIGSSSRTSIRRATSI